VRRTDPSALAWLVGNELRQARERLGETQAAAARIIGCSTSRMNYLESGRTVQQPDDVRALMRFYGAEPDGTRLATLVADAGKRPWWAPWKSVAPPGIHRLLGLEGLADTAFGYQPLVVPELLQVADYTAALLTPTVATPVQRARLVELRAARQQRLTATPPLRLAAILDEDALYRAVDGPTVLRTQLAHLVELADRCEIRVMPRAVAVHDGIDGALTILGFDAARPVAQLGTGEHATILTDPDDVAHQLYRRDRMRALALSPDDSRALITGRLTRITS
jgi:transcriptional regulator with XRE-family HTH domain